MASAKVGFSSCRLYLQFVFIERSETSQLFLDDQRQTVNVTFKKSQTLKFRIRRNTLEIACSSGSI